MLIKEHKQTVKNIEVLEGKYVVMCQYGLWVKNTNKYKGLLWFKLMATQGDKGGFLLVCYL